MVSPEGDLRLRAHGAERRQRKPVVYQEVAAARSYQPLTAAEMAALTERGKQLAALWGPLRGPVA